MSGVAEVSIARSVLMVEVSLVVKKRVICAEPKEKAGQDG
jgi:hypothetical protein